MVPSGPAIDDQRTASPADSGSSAPVPPEAPWDEEHPEHVPGSFLKALPQFFVFPMILVATLTAVWLGLRWMAGSENSSAAELFAEMRQAGPHSRWQAAQQLADGLQRGRIDLDAVPSLEIASTYDTLVPDDISALSANAQEQVSLLRRYLLHVMAYKPDPALRPYLVEALSADDSNVRMAGLAAFKRLAAGDSAPVLMPLLASEVAEERLLAISALGAVGAAGSVEARAALAGLLGGADTLDHRNAVLALAACGDARATPWLLPMLSRDSYAQDPALVHADQLGADEASRKAARQDVIEAFLVNAARASVHLGAQPGAAELIPALQELRSHDPSLKVQSAAINALHDLGASTET